MPLLHFVSVVLVEAPDDIERCLLVVHEFNKRPGEEIVPAAVCSDNERALLEETLQRFRKLRARTGQLNLSVEGIGIPPESVQVNYGGDTCVVRCRIDQSYITPQNLLHRMTTSFVNSQRHKRVKVCR